MTLDIRRRLRGESELSDGATISSDGVWHERGLWPAGYHFTDHYYGGTVEDPSMYSGTYDVADADLDEYCLRVNTGDEATVTLPSEAYDPGTREDGGKIRFAFYVNDNDKGNNYAEIKEDDGDTLTYVAVNRHNDGNVHVWDGDEYVKAGEVTAGEWDFIELWFINGKDYCYIWCGGQWDYAYIVKTVTDPLGSIRFVAGNWDFYISILDIRLQNNQVAEIETDPINLEPIGTYKTSDIWWDDQLGVVIDTGKLTARPYFPCSEDSSTNGGCTIEVIADASMQAAFLLETDRDNGQRNIIGYGTAHEDISKLYIGAGGDYAYTDDTHDLGIHQFSLVLLDNGDGYLYLDGEEVISASNAFTTGAWQDLRVGGRGSDDKYDAAIGLYEVRVWDKPLTSADISEYTFTRLEGNEDGLKNLYRINEGEGETLHDSVGSDDGQLSQDGDPDPWRETAGQTAISTDGGSSWTDWASISRNDPIDQLTDGDDLTNTLVKFRFLPKNNYNLFHTSLLNVTDHTIYGSKDHTDSPQIGVSTAVSQEVQPDSVVTATLNNVVSTDSTVSADSTKELNPSVTTSPNVDANAYADLASLSISGVMDGYNITLNEMDATTLQISYITDIDPSSQISLTSATSISSVIDSTCAGDVAASAEVNASEITDAYVEVNALSDVSSLSINVSTDTPGIYLAQSIECQLGNLYTESLSASASGGSIITIDREQLNRLLGIWYEAVHQTDAWAELSHVDTEWAKSTIESTEWTELSNIDTIWSKSTHHDTSWNRS